MHTVIILHRHFDRGGTFLRVLLVLLGGVFYVAARDMRERTVSAQPSAVMPSGI